MDCFELLLTLFWLVLAVVVAAVVVVAAAVVAVAVGGATGVGFGGCLAKGVRFRVDGFRRRPGMNGWSRGYLNRDSREPGFLEFHDVKLVLSGIGSTLQARVRLVAKDHLGSRVCDQTGISEMASFSSLRSEGSSHNYIR